MPAFCWQCLPLRLCYSLQLSLLSETQTLTMLNFSFNGALQNYDCTELVQHCIVLATVGVLHTARTAAGRFAVAALNQLQCLFKQNREQRGCLHTCKFYNKVILITIMM